MMGSGGRIRPVEKAHLSIIMEMCFREIGHITKLMDMVCSNMPIVRQCIGATGLMMCRMVKVRKFMRMGIVMLVSSRTEEGTAWGLTTSPTGGCMTDSGKTGKWRAMVDSSGKMAVSITVNGCRTKSTEMAITSGKTGVPTKAATNRTKSTDRENFPGTKTTTTSGNGSKISVMELVCRSRMGWRRRVSGIVISFFNDTFHIYIIYHLIE